MNRGYIRVWRKIEDSGIMRNPEICRLFLYLLLKAASKPRRQMIGTMLVPLEPGQVIVGRKALAAELGTTEGKIRTCLATLQKMEIIGQQPTNRFSLVSILNWNKYQNGAGADNRQAAIRQPAGNQQTTGRQPAGQPPDQQGASIAPPALSGSDHQQASQRKNQKNPEISEKPHNATTNKNKEYKNKNTLDTTPADTQGSTPSATNRRAGQSPACCPAAGRGSPFGGDRSAPSDQFCFPAKLSASPGATAPGERGEGGVSVEFLELRDYYDKHARAEAPGAGVAEYRQCRAARVWPGLDVIVNAIDTLAARDDQWQRGFAPGLAKFLREKQWQKKPAPPPQSTGGGPPNWAARGGDPTIFSNLSTAERVLANRQGGGNHA